jgi:predicted nucleic acid-binding protein
MCSSFARMVRLGQISSNSQAMALVTLDRLRESWREIVPTDGLRERAEIFVDRFGLTAGDALQLAAAWMWCSGHPRNRTFISGDARLVDSAKGLGFNPIVC